MKNWSPQQIKALDTVTEWIKEKDGNQVFRLFGYAGTGKSTLAIEMAHRCDGKVQFAAFTGKAARVMKSKGCYNATTIHSLIYNVVEDEDTKKTGTPKFVLNPDSPVQASKLVIIDEVSMVDESLGKDLLSFGVKILVLGDPEQLPPISGTGYFTSQSPDVMLTEVHRQAVDSPIINLATVVRMGGELEYGEYGDCRVIRRADLVRADILETDQIIVGKNATRQMFNSRIRELKEITSELPILGEKVICLRNNRQKKILNGSMWTVTDTLDYKNSKMADYLKERLSVMKLESEDDGLPVQVQVRKEFWRGEEDKLEWNDKKYCDDFTFGYAITAHKSQGSQWDNVTLFDESFVFRDDAKRHLYTAITRAAKKITIIR